VLDQRHLVDRVVAIGLRHQHSPRAEAVPPSALWIQELMLGPGRAMGDGLTASQGRVLPRGRQNRP
jgi:hypothetical protein